MLEILFNGKYAGLELAFTIMLPFLITFLGFVHFRKILPKDQGREFAVNGALSEGKPRGAGLILIIAFVISCVLTVRLDVEYISYILLVFCSMMTGYFDDAASTPWGEGKKGVLDLVISVALAYAYYKFNSSHIVIATLGIDFTIPPVLFVVLGTILVWASINVTNCSDGVDGLCASLCVVSLMSSIVLIHKLAPDSHFEEIVVIMIACVLAYLWFNASPSKMLMGDAGSRALGVMLAVCFLKTSAPIMFIPCAIVLVIDGGMGLIKLSAIRYLKLKNFMKNIRTPIHDHLRKNNGWSDTQTVFRLVILQCIVSGAFIAIAI